ncbi:MAG: hypothetical protein LBK72_11085 [Bifidobacteriaceae bacterium]|jgi:DNA-binding response OmpR family regulator|nr:hypothetical protein [Bifidobacteriaceae bacterium]
MTQGLTDVVARDTATRAARVLLFSDNATTRRAVRDAVGTVVGAGGVTIAWTEVATGTAAVAEAVDDGGFDLLILDAEAGKLGGMGVARFVGDEVAAPPPILVLIARPQDAWLAAWSGDVETLTYPADPFEVARTVSRMLGADA